jgi:DNA-binding MarR family transcriptional regulator
LTTLDPVRLLQSVIRVEVDLFDAVDARLRADADMLLIELMPLRIIGDTADCRVQDYAEAMGLTVGGASKSVDRLERRGWVRRLPHPTDRRSSLIDLTAEGRAARAGGDRIAAEVIRDRLGVLSAAETGTLDALLTRLDPSR